MFHATIISPIDHDAIADVAIAHQTPHGTHRTMEHNHHPMNTMMPVFPGIPIVNYVSSLNANPMPNDGPCIHYNKHISVRMPGHFVYEHRYMTIHRIGVQQLAINALIPIYAVRRPSPHFTSHRTYEPWLWEPTPPNRPYRARNGQWWRTYQTTIPSPTRAVRGREWPEMRGTCPGIVPTPWGRIDVTMERANVGGITWRGDGCNLGAVGLQVAAEVQNGCSWGAIRKLQVGCKTGTGKLLRVATIDGCMSQRWV